MRKTYINHKPSEEGINSIEILRQAVDHLHTYIESVSPKSREQSLALTKLEECLMWAVKGIVLNDPHSTPQPVPTVKECPDCCNGTRSYHDGIGVIDQIKCDTCNGTGRISK